MRVLVAAASKHGATMEIAQAIGDTLAASHIAVTVSPIEAVSATDEYHAFVVGSAVYAGHWLKSAKEFTDRNAEALATRAAWLFSSGPIGDPPKPDEDPVDTAELMKETKARHHALFAGKLDKDRLGFAEKAIVVALRAPEGDYRNWGEIRRWASGIADVLHAEK